MTDPTLPTGPDPEAIAAYVTTTYPETDVIQAIPLLTVAHDRLGAQRGRHRLDDHEAS